MNRENFRELADRIELEDRFDLNYYAHDVARKDPATTGLLADDCGTVGCVAGWACALAGLNYEGSGTHEGRIWAAASGWLGIDREAAHRLFYAERGSVWARVADDFGWRQDGSDGALVNWSAISAVQAAKVLRMIADGEVEL